MSGAEVVLALKVVGSAFAAKTAIEGIKERNLFKAVLGGVGAFFGVSSIASQVAAGSAAAGTAASTAAPQGAAAVAGTAGGAAAAPATTIGQAAAGGIGAIAPGAWEGVNLAGMTPAASNALAFGSDLARPLSGAALGAANATSPLLSQGSSLAPGLGMLSQGAPPPAPVNPSDPTTQTFGLGQVRAPGVESAPPGASGGLLSAPLERGGSLESLFQEVDKTTKGMSNFSIGAVKKWAEDNPLLAASLLQIGGSTLSGFATAQQRENELQRILNLRAEERARRGAVPVASGTYNWNFS